MKRNNLWQQKRIGDGHWSAFGHLYVAAFWRIEMAKATNIFDFSKHSKDLFLVAGSHTTQKHIDWMKAGQRTITRYNLPMNETTVACLSNNPKYLLLYLHYKTAEQTL